MFWSGIRAFALISLLGSVAAPVLLLAAFEGSRRGATPGKRIVGLRVVDRATGGPIGLRRALLRRLVALLGQLPFYAGWWWVLVGDARETWHDKAARTAVVRDGGSAGLGG